MGYIQLRVCDCCKEEILQEDAYKITKVIMETDRFTDAAGSRDYNQINLELCTNCAERLVDSLSKILDDFINTNYKKGIKNEKNNS